MGHRNRNAEGRLAELGRRRRRQRDANGRQREQRSLGLHGCGKSGRSGRSSRKGSKGCKVAEDGNAKGRPPFADKDGERFVWAARFWCNERGRSGIESKPQSGGRWRTLGNGDENAAGRLAQEAISMCMRVGMEPEESQDLVELWQLGDGGRVAGEGRGGEDRGSTLYLGNVAGTLVRVLVADLSKCGDS